MSKHIFIFPTFHFLASNSRSGAYPRLPEVGISLQRSLSDPLYNIIKAYLKKITPYLPEKVDKQCPIFQ